MRFFAEKFVYSEKSRTFAPTQRHTSPIGTECRHPERILRKATQLMAVDQPRRVFFYSFDILNAPAQIFQPGGRVSLGPGCRGRAPLQASEPKISLVRFSVTRVFLKKSVFKSV